MTSPQSRGIAVTTRGLVKNFDGRPVINQLNLHVPAGEFLAIVGRSGCGKSTLLRLLTGLDTPSGGALSFGADQAHGTPRDTARIMFQEPRLLPWASVVDNVAVGLSSIDVPSAVAKERALATLRDTGLAHKADAWPSTLSGGQKQRVALARALVSQPRFIAFDEPLGALDALTRIEMQGLIERVYLEQGFTAILVTHDVREALSLADRVIMLDGGRVALDIQVPLPRPRPRVSASLAELEDHILSRLVTPQDQQAA